MSNKLVGRIYLRREKDIIHLLSIKANTKNGDIYFSMPVSDEQKKFGIDNVKSSYHADGQTHLTTVIPGLLEIDNDKKRATVKGLGFNGSKVYAVSERNKPIAEIDNVTKIGQGASFNDINTLNHSLYKIVSFDDIKWGSEIIDSRKYKHLSLQYFIIPKSKIKDAAGHTTDEYYMFPHPSLDLFIAVRIFDFWDDAPSANISG